MAEDIKIPNNSKIDKALKEFEAQSGTQKIPKILETLKTSDVPRKEVEGVKFEIPSPGSQKQYNETATPKMVQLVMKWSGGAIKEQRQAEYVLLGFVVVAIIVSLLLFYNSTSSSRNQKLTPEQQSQLLKIMPQDGPPITH